MIRLIDRPSPNFDPRPQGERVEMLVLHYTGMESGEAALARLCDREAEVSAHYLVEEDGRIFRLVDEAMRAWHAGVSTWRGRAGVNARSIGVELVNPGHEFGYRPFPEAQMLALIDLCRDILSRHPMPSGNVVGHSDVAPSRKQDPGELFDWRGLAGVGIGIWPESPDLGDPTMVTELLGAWGYDVSDARAALIAFQRHFRPRLIDGVADGESAGILSALLAGD